MRSRLSSLASGPLASLACVGLSAPPLVASPALAQPHLTASHAAAEVPTRATGRIVGRVIDAATGAGLSDVGIQAGGTTLGTVTGVDGRFTLPAVPAGPVSLLVRRIGYQAKTVTGLTVPAGGSVEQNVVLATATVQLRAVAVTAAAERGTVSEALDRQRTATAIVSSITAEQIARSPDRDAAQAVQRVSGVTVSDGRYVLVRGLGERYTTTSLNGARVPSPEPERKVVPLDLFPSALLQSVTTSKTFTPDQPGDFTGASVDITTREFPARRLVAFSVTTGVNSVATGKDLPSGARLGTEWLGFAGAGRAMPAQGTLRARALSPADSRAFVGALHNNWTPFVAAGTPNAGVGASVGGQTTAIGGHAIGYVGSLSYTNSQEARTDELRQLVVGGGTAKVRTFNSYQGRTGRQSVLWGGIANVSTMLGEHTRLSLNNMYNRSADNEAHLDEGFDESQSPDPVARTSSVRRTWLDFVERAVRSTQLHGEHAFGRAQNLDWTVASSGVTRGEPDRTDVFLRRDTPTSPYLLALGEPRAARRLYASLTENAIAPAANYRVRLGPETRPWQLEVGGAWRDTRRHASSDPFYFTSPTITEGELRQTPEQLFPALVAESRVTVDLDPDAGSYRATDRVGAGYAMAEVPLGERLRVIGGARVEHWSLDLSTRQTVGDAFDSTYTSTDVLPSLALNVKVGDAQNLRFSASRTLSRPEYRELSPLQERGPIGDLDFVGNPKLQRAMIDNLDARWELYPNPGEIVSVALFAKRFDHPIERVQVSTNGGNIYSFVNADAARNYGVELEARKSFGAFAEARRPFSGFTNVTLMRSTITPGNTDISALTSADRPMVGQAPYVVNAGLSWSSLGGGTSATLLYNVVGKAITATGTKPTPDTFVEPRHMLDLSLQLPVARGLSAKVNARNLLDAPYEERAGGLTRLRYHTGRVLSLTLGWTR